MADTLYLSLWYPNLRLEALPDKLTAVLGAFAAHGGEPRVYAATVWPVSWSEPPVFQQVWGRRITVGGEGETQLGAEPRAAVEAATELLHEDFAYEFQIGWSLWEVENLPGDAGPRHGGQPFDSAHGPPTHRDKAAMNGAQPAQDDKLQLVGQLEEEQPRVLRLAALAQDDKSVLRSGQDDKTIGRWVRGPRLVRVTGYGPLFDEGAYEQDGHIRIDLGSDGPFLEEDVPLDEVGARHVEENVRQLVGLAGAVEKASGATARLLWSELGESLAQRLAARLGVAN
jgi:hypothetical protein